MKVFLLVWVLFTSSYGLTTQQIKIKRLAEVIAKKELYKYRSLAVAVCLTESSFGLNIVGDDSNSLGEMQVSIGAIREVSKWYPKDYGYLKLFTDHHLKTKLVRNSRFSLTMGIVYLKGLIHFYGWREGLSRYNGGRLNTRYINRVLKNMRINKTLNNK